MFGLIKKKKKEQEYEFKCPMYDRVYSMELDPEQITDYSYQYSHNSGFIGPFMTSEAAT